MDNCNDNYHCRMAIAPILHHCDQSRCSRNSCMEALKGFYSRPSFHWNLEVAFCLCRKTDDKQDRCIVAQQRLHPSCAQRPLGIAEPTCLSVAETCLEDKECRSILEHFGQKCAIDSLTRQCSGPTSECRMAMLSILGTELRTNCVCKGTDVTQFYDCLGWQRILWLNPCVVESQIDFNRKKSEERALLSTTPTPTITSQSNTIMKYPVEQKTIMSYTQSSIQNRDNAIIERIEPAIVLTTRSPTSITTFPPRYCVFQREEFTAQYIKEGTFKRIYHEDESDCSEICKCGKGEELICKTMCVDRMPCKSDFALYNHAAPSYQAYRGRCLCYSGSFICIKSSTVEPELPPGIYLFLGFSGADQLQLKHHTDIVIQDIVHTLQRFITKEAVNGSLCTVQLLNTTVENVILAGKLSTEVVDYNMLSPKESFAKEKAECAQIFEVITNKINMHSPDFSTHLLLSLFKIAEVEIIQLEESSGSTSVFMDSKLLGVIISVLPIFQLSMTHL